MNKKTVKGFIIGMLTTIMLLTSVSAFASSTSVTKKISVVFNNIKVAVDGKTIDFGKDSAGKKIEPFIYNGTTYLPIQSAAKALGEKVYWDGKKQTVYIGERPGEVKYLTEVLGAYGGKAEEFKLNDTNKTLYLAGQSYKTGYMIHANGHKSFNFNSKYSSLTFDFAVSQYVEQGANGYLEIYLDGELYKTIEVTSNSTPESITIPIKGVNQAQISHKYGFGYNFMIGVGDPILK